MNTIGWQFIYQVFVFVNYKGILKRNYLKNMLTSSTLQRNEIKTMDKYNYTCIYTVYTYNYRSILVF